MPEDILYLDFETACDLDISEVGAYKYVQHESFHVILVGSKLNDGPTHVHEPIMGMPKADVIYAHNALFDYLVYRRVYEYYNWPSRFTDIRLWRDSMALAARYTLPMNLAKAGAAIDLNIQKQPQGKAFIKKICCPPYEYTKTDMELFISYCHDDVESMYELIHSLPNPELTDHEQDLWVITQLMNLRGLPIDLETTEAIVRTTDVFLEEQQRILPELTDGEITKITQVQRIKKFCIDKGVDIPNTQAPTIKEWLEKDLPSEVRDVLILRSEFGSTAIKKFKTLRNYHCEGRVHGTFCYYGAQKTGRWAGRGFQPHNLPRAAVDNPEYFIDKFRNYEIIDNPIQTAKALIRPMICAPEGQSFLVSDYASIENRDLAWIAHDQKTLDLFYTGLDQYKDMASFLFNVDYSEVTKDQRWMGKIIILGCGYGMGHKLFQITAAGYGTDLTLTESKFAVDSYRKRYRLVVKLWYALYKKAILAAKHEGVTFEYNGIVLKTVRDKMGRPWLSMKLHSGRTLLYMQPKVRPGKFGDEVTYMGMNPYSKKWQRLAITPGKLTENVCQAECRDIMGNGMLNIENNMPEVELLATIHDEAISIAWDEDIVNTNILDQYNIELCRAPSWADGFPLEAEGYIAKRYKKG